MFDIDDRSWIAQSVVAQNANAEITFVLYSMFHRDPNSLDEANVIGLPVPGAISSEPIALSSKEALNNMQGLVDHYRAVLQLARQHGRSYNEFSHHMKLQLQFLWSDGVLGFSWRDTLDSMESLFNWLRDSADGDIWSDVEQGWEMIIVRVGSSFHFREGGFDQGGEYVNIALPREELLDSISGLRKRIHIIIGRLTADLGEDYWSRYRYDLRTDLM